VQGRTLLLSEPEALELCLQQALARDELPMSLRFALVEHTAPLEARGAQLLAEGWRREREPSELAVRLVAAGALGVHAQALGPRVLELLQHQRDDLRSLAADTLAKLAWAPALEPLVLSLARAEGRSKRRIARALHVLTGVHAGASPSAWRRWFDQEGAAWVAGEHELGGHEDSADSPAGAGRYHGIVIVGERVLFVLDRSKSMSQTVATGAEEGETRMQRALEELIATLGSLPEHMQFGVVVFAGRVTRFQPGLVSASAENIAAAQAWVTELELELGTAVYDALESAFQIAGHPPADDWHALGVDTMFLLTDGRPVLSGGKNDNLGRIRADLRRWNLLGRVVVHTIGLGDNVPKQFMRRLAQENGGTFVHERSER